MHTHIHDYHLTNPGHAVQIGKAVLAKSNPPNKPPGMSIESKQKDNLLIRDLCH